MDVREGGVLLVISVNQDSMVITIGKGQIVLEKEILSHVQGKSLILELGVEKGPCSDDLCQVRSVISTRLSDSIPDKRYKTFTFENYSIAVSDAVYRSIDRGREKISVTVGVTGNLYVKGFSVTM